MRASVDSLANRAQDGAMRLVALLLVVVSGCGGQFRVEHISKAALVTSTMLLLCDSMQTLKIAGQGWPDGRHEENPIIGKKPSAGVVFGYSASVIALNWLAWVITPKRYRWILPSTLTVTQARQIHTNERHGTGWCGFGGTANVN
jgi:hypothetical protein